MTNVEFGMVGFADEELGMTNEFNRNSYII